MRMVNLNRDDAYPLVDQIVDGIRFRIDARDLRPGSRLPSIRVFARDHGISRFTVVEAYDRLVATGYLSSRRGAGFYTRTVRDEHPVVEGSEASKGNEELVWLIRRLLEAREGTVLAGGPWLPKSWLDEPNLQRAVRGSAGQPGHHVTAYGDAYGYRPLREHIAEVMLPEIGVATNAANVLLTTGASQALDLVVRGLLRRGDTVLVDDPGYYNLFGNLRLQGVRMIPVPRRHDGPDVEAVDALAQEHRPKLYFTQSVLQNPTGTNMSAHVAHRILQAASRHDFLIVEDDIFSDFVSTPVTRLASLDQLARVIYVGSFSKTLSGSIRVGFLSAGKDLVDALADAKMVTAICSSLFSEMTVYRYLADGHYRKFAARLRDRLSAARCITVRFFERTGIECFAAGDDGMFVWGRLDGVEDSLPMAEKGLRDGVLLAPGTVFTPNLHPSPWLRFNVAVCEDSAVQERLSELFAHAG